MHVKEEILEEQRLEIALFEELKPEDGRDLGYRAL